MAAFDRRARRGGANVAFIGFCWFSALLAIAALLAILASLVVQGIGGLNLHVLTLDTPAAGSPGGLRNAILGSLMICVLAMLIAVFVGVLAGTWLAEYGREGRYASVVRFVNDVLLSAPSILVGLFVYELLVKPFHGFSGWAGAVALALIAAPVVTRTTEDVLKLQARQLRESGIALGTPVWTTIRLIMWRAAGGGIVTGALLAFAPHLGRDGAAALHRAEQPVLQPQHVQADGQPADGDLQLCALRLRRLAPAGLGGRPPHRRHGAGHQHTGARAEPGAEQPMTSTVTPIPVAADAGPPSAAAEREAAAAGRFETHVEPLAASQVKLETRALNFHYGKTRSLHEVSLPFKRNGITALIGPSGCGKSTLLRALNRIYALYAGQRAEGEVLLDGENILDRGVDLATLRSRIGMVFQQPTPFPMSIYDNVAFGVRLYEKLSRADMDARVEESLRRSALWEEVKDKLKTSGLGLSGGQQQRLCVARGVAVRPEVLLLDEPASALDPISTAKLEETLVELKRDLTVVIVTHNLQQAARISDNAAFMYLGRLIEFAPTAQLFDNPRVSRTADYITGRFG